MNPAMSILDRRFQYTPAAKTNIRERFERIRKEQEAAKKVSKKNERQQRSHS